MLYCYLECYTVIWNVILSSEYYTVIRMLYCHQNVILSCGLLYCHHNLILSSECYIMWTVILSFGMLYCYLECYTVIWNVILSSECYTVIWNMPSSECYTVSWNVILPFGYYTVIWKVILSFGMLYCQLKCYTAIWNVILSVEILYCHLECYTVIQNIIHILVMKHCSDCFVNVFTELSSGIMAQLRCGQSKIDWCQCKQLWFFLIRMLGWFGTNSSQSWELVFFRALHYVMFYLHVLWYIFIIYIAVFTYFSYDKSK